MKNLRNFALAAFALLGFAACQQEEFAPEIKNPTHSVTFVAGAPETKTTVTIDGNTAKFAWTKADEKRFTVYENGTAATETVGILDDKTGKMTLMATFTGDAPASPKYQALYNTEVSATQIVTKDSYAETTDVMVSDVLDGTREDHFLFSFKREVAFAKMTLKDLTRGAYVSSVTIESDKPIAGQYDLKTGTFINTSNVITLDVFNDVVDGNATVLFTTIPVENAKFTITAETTDDAETVAGTYTKTFSKTITLTRGDVKGFGVAMTELVDPHKDDNGWFLVKDARFLAAGDVIRIGCASAGKVAGALNGQIISSESATYENEQMVSVSSAEDYTLGGNEGAWTLSSLTGKLGATAVKKLSENDTAANYVGTWTIDIDSEGAATIAPSAEGYGRILCNNTSGQEKFTTYTSSTNASMLLPGIYKKYGTPAETKKDQTISFNPTIYTATIGKENTYPTLTAQSSGAKTWTSSNTEVATINESTGDITLVAAGKTTISVTVAGDDTYNEGTGSYELTVAVVSSETWSLVTDASTLAEGDVIVIVAADAAFAMSTTQNSNNRGQAAITKNTDNTVTITNEVQKLTLGAGIKTGTFSLSTSSGYLYAASSSKNYLRTQTTLDANASWTITIADNVATIKAQGTNTNNWLKYNSSSSMFSCYSSGQGDVQIYRMNDTRASQSISYSAETGSIDKYTSVKDIPTLDLSGVKTTVSYTSSDATVATVSESGEIAPLKAGTTTITAIAAASAEYREAKASFVLTVTDSSPYLTATANKTSVAAAGETVTITVDTNVDGWTASSNNAAFAVGTPSGNTVDVVVSENKDASERTATITVTAGTLSETITLTQKGASTGGDPTEQTVFLETFGSTTSNTAVASYTGYSATADMFTTSEDVKTHYSGDGSVGKKDLSLSNLSSGYTGASGLSGCYHLGTANTEATILQISDINITDCVNISVSFGALGGSKDHKVSVYYKIDGGAETALITNGAITNKSWTLLNANISGTGKSLTLKFKHKPSKGWTIRMDDIRVVGTK